MCKVFFMDGKTKAVSLQPKDTTIEVLEKVARKIGLKSVEGWALYEVSSTVFIAVIMLMIVIKMLKKLYFTGKLC